jgi:hypothetical protein
MSGCKEDWHWGCSEYGDDVLSVQHAKGASKEDERWLKKWYRWHMNMAEGKMRFWKNWQHPLHPLSGCGQTYLKGQKIIQRHLNKSVLQSTHFLNAWFTILHVSLNLMFIWYWYKSYRQKLILIIPSYH